MARFCSGALVLVLLSTLPACAQEQEKKKGGFGRGGFGRGGFGLGRVALLQQTSVQEELKLTDDQVSKVKELATSRKGGFGAFKDLSKEERAAKMAEQTKADDKALADILKGDQLKRLKQISLQVRGAQVFADPEVAAALKLTDEQKEKLKDIRDKGREEMRELFQGGDRDKLRTKIEELRKTNTAASSAVLTSEQQNTWSEMTGAPFTGEIRYPDFGGKGQRRKRNKDATR